VKHRIVLKLYITGQAAWAERNLDRLCRYFEAGGRADVEATVVDVLAAPQLAEAHRIIATPTLVKEHPLPARKVIGDLSDLDRVASFLGLEERALDAPTGSTHGHGMF
jgi:circadian clock protein KaiB